MSTRTHVLVVGAGFAGGMAAVRLAGRSRGRVAVTVVNPRPAFVNRLRLHRAAVGQQIPLPSLRRILGRDVTFVEGYVTSLDLAMGRATVATDGDTTTIPFDRVVLATGSSTEPVPVPGGEHAYAVGDLESARRLRPAFSALPEGAHVAVVGGGFTGLETVAELAEARPDLRTSLVTAGDVGGWFNERGHAHVAGTLARLGVATADNVRVQAIEPHRLLLADGGEVPSDLTVWCGGFAVPPLAREAGLAVDDQGAVLTDASLQSVSHPQVLAVGDAGHTPTPAGGRYSMSCQFAFPSAAHAADVLRAEALGIAPDGGHPATLDLGFVGRSVSLGGHDGVFQLTGRDDAAADFSLTGRRAVAMKRIQLWSVERATAWERRAPGMTRWPSAGGAASAGAPTAGTATGATTATAASARPHPTENRMAG
ncbi:NAD(P)/FAD-dependent oxidoreductase [Antribacter gilvus]|uniref:NAD(P)/FAD-dependent oxidoreductase n=1 Tax=Antribacter gilvus TaxID=2304675 RepID=UPI0013DE8ECC|nr:FAD-dependent oxidoreductase [Antribacter gilvus]